MKVIHHNFKRTISCIGLLLCFTACEEFIQIDLPKNELTTETVFESDAVAQAAMRGIYAEMTSASSPFSGSIQSVTNLQGISSDESFYRFSGDLLDINNNSVITANNIVRQNWNALYQFIHYSNSLMEGLNNSTQVSGSVKEQLIGEAKFIRAFCYYYLINLWGDVPLVLTTDYRENMTMPRIAKSLVHQQVIADLKDAKAVLNEDYSVGIGERVRANKWVAMAMLARVYLYSEDWINAETEATAIINNTSYYSLCDNINEVFIKNNTEAIWQLFPTIITQDTHEGPLFLPSTVASSITNYPLTNTFADSFENEDERRAEWIRSKTVNGVNYFYPFKYKVRFITAGAPHTEYSVLLRLAEQYLIRAEARIRQGNVIGPNSAESDINIIRNRAGLSNTTAISQEDMVLAIEQERRFEFFSEWGHRWFDLIRTGRANSVLGAIKADWQPEDMLWPIPQTELNRNPNLKQNPGY